MKTKQILALVLTCLILLVTGAVGIVSAKISREAAASEKEVLTETIDSIFSSKSKIKLPQSPYLGKIDIEGAIQGSSDVTDIFGNVSGGYNHDLYMEFVNKMMEDENNKGIFLFVDSPGGTVYHSDEMFNKLKEYKETTGRPIYAYFGSMAASGGLYIPMASDYIYANKNCWTGSIGVISSFYNYSELFSKLGIEEINITSGANKAMGSGGVEMTEEQREIMQSLVDESFDEFVKVVAYGRNLSESRVREIADGRIYSALQAKEIGLVDEIASYEEAVKKICDKEDITESDFYTPNPPITNSFSKFLFGLSKKNNESDSEIRAAMDLMDRMKSGVLMYYAR